MIILCTMYHLYIHIQSPKMKNRPKTNFEMLVLSFSLIGKSIHITRTHVFKCDNNKETYVTTRHRNEFIHLFIFLLVTESCRKSPEISERK